MLVLTALALPWHPLEDRTPDVESHVARDFTGTMSHTLPKPLWRQRFRAADTGPGLRGMDYAQNEVMWGGAPGPHRISAWF